MYIRSRNDRRRKHRKVTFPFRDDHGKQVLQERRMRYGRRFADIEKELQEPNGGMLCSKRQ